MALFYKDGVPIGGIALMLAMLASMGGFIFGYDTGQISDILLMKDFLLRFADTCTDPSDYETCSFSDVRSGLIVGLLSIGTLVGALLGAPTADILGRRYAMTVECLLFIIGVIIQMTSFHAWQQFAVGRLISGLAVGALSAAVPMYQAETAPSQIRGTLTATYQLFITFGILVAYCISIGARNIDGAGSWQTVVGIGIVWPLILGIGILFMPESPRWLMSTANPNDKRHADRATRAAYSLAAVRGIPRSEASTNELVQSELDQIQSGVEKERRAVESAIGASIDEVGWFQAGLKSWLSCFKPERKTLYRTLLGMALQSFQQLTGANYFFYYGATIFKSVGISDSFITQIILGAVNFICTFGGLYVMERFGRRVPLIIGGLWQAAWLFVFAAAGTAKDPIEEPLFGKLMIASACLFILGYATTWAPGVWILIGETFATRTRAKQGAIATAANWTWNFLISFCTPFIVRPIAYKYGFVFASCNFAGALFVYFFLYESSNLTLEAVDEMYNDPTCKPWTSKSWRDAHVLSAHEVEKGLNGLKREPKNQNTGTTSHEEVTTEKAV